MKVTTRCGVFFLVPVFCFAFEAIAQKTWYVDRIHCNASNQRGTEDKPFCTITGAIDNAKSGDTVLVKPATYNGSVNFSGKDLVLKSTDGPAVTILDGTALQSVVLFQDGEGAGAVLEGFTVTGGVGINVPLFVRAGGGILCNGASPTIRGNVIEGNEAFWGGGLMLINSEAIILRNVIRNNIGSDSHDADPEHLTGAGAGMMAVNSNPTLVANVFYKNDSALYGGAIHFAGDHIGEPNVPKLYGNVLAENVASDYGGGMSVFFDVDVEFFGNTMANNVSEGAYSGFSGGGIGLLGPTSRVRADSSIFYGNFDLLNDKEVFVYQGRFEVGHSNVDGGISQVELANGGTLNWRAGNVDVNPLFVNPAAGDYHLTSCSPMANAGNPAYVVAPLETDLDGEARSQHGQVDVGADEISIPCGTCGGSERIAKLKCKKGSSLVVKLEGGAPGDAFNVELSGGEAETGALNGKGAGKVKFKTLSQGSGMATATWGCGATDAAPYSCS